MRAQEARMPLHVYTAQRECYHGRDRLDLTTLTSVSRAFVCEDIIACPTTRASAQRAHERYLVFLRRSYRAQRLTWQTVLARSRLVVVCSCPPGRLTCRRYVLAEVLGKLGACLGGELRLTHPNTRVTPSPLRRSKS